MNYSSITLARDTHHPKALLLLIIFINPPISSIQHWRKLLLQFSTHFGDPHNPITFLPPNRLCSFVSPLLYPLYHPWDTIHMYEYTVAHTHTPTHTLVHGDRYKQTRTHAHAGFSGVCWGVISLTQGHCDYVFSVLESEGGDKGASRLQ